MNFLLWHGPQKSIMEYWDSATIAMWEHLACKVGLIFNPIHSWERTFTSLSPSVFYIVRTRNPNQQEGSFQSGNSLSSSYQATQVSRVSSNSQHLVLVGNQEEWSDNI